MDCLPLVAVIMTTANGRHQMFSGGHWMFSDQIFFMPDKAYNTLPESTVISNHTTITADTHTVNTLSLT